MSMLRIRRGILGLAVIPALVGAVGGCTTKEGPGLKVTIDRGDFQPAKMKVAISADHGGFAFQMRDNSMGVGVTTEDLDGDGALELIAEFVQPDPTVSFRVQANSAIELTLKVRALAFDKDNLIASAVGVAPPLPPAATARSRSDWPGTRARSAPTRASPTSGPPRPTSPSGAER